MPLIAAATFLQSRLGVSFAPAEVIGPIAGFSILAVLAVWVAVLILRNVAESAPETPDTI